jgi:hypothetical protein
LRILFLAHRMRYVRHFDGAIRTLAERGHTVCIAAVVARSKLERPEGLDHPGVSVKPCPRLRADEWHDLVRPLRMARDYIRYFDPTFARATRLRQRAESKAETQAGRFKQFCDRRPWARRHWRLVERALRTVEELIPSDRAFEAFLECERPDVVLITRMVEFGSYLTDYVKAAHRLGIPVAYLPFSWDNLTTKGLIRVIPDRVLVWNEAQRREAVELHRVPADRVVVTGAPRFDAFFAMKPSTTREEFCARAGLDPARPFVLYLGSANLVTNGREVEFARRWIEEVHRSPTPNLRTCGILIRPHPDFAEEPDWRAFDVSDLPNVAMSGRGKLNADPGLYDALHHAAAVVGLNTSAMIEAGIVGKPVYTILVPEFEGQEGTLHFDYLLRENGGLVSPARGFDEHRRQLAAALASGEDGRERTLAFLEGFVRPYGLDVPATPIMVREIERLADIRKRPGRAPLWHAPARRALHAWLARRVAPATVGALGRIAASSGQRTGKTSVRA